MSDVSDELPDPDEIPVYDEEDPDDDHYEHVQASDHRNIDDLPDQELEQ